MGLRELGGLLLLANLWSVSFLFIRVAVPAFGPVPLVDVRVLIAGVLLVAWAALRGGVPPFWRRWKRYVLLGALNMALPLVLVSASQLAVSASTTAILLATVPLFSAPMAAVWLKEGLTRRQGLGLVVGLVGVGVLVGWSPVSLTTPMLLAIGAILLAAICYGLGGILSAVGFGGASPTELTIGQLVATFLLLLPLSVAMPPPAWPPPEAVGAVLALAILSTVFGYLVFFGLIQAVGTTRTQSVGYLIPVFGTAWGVLVLGEPFGPTTVVGMLVVLGGVALVTKARLPRPAGVLRSREWVGEEA